MGFAVVVADVVLPPVGGGAELAVGAVAANVVLSVVRSGDGLGAGVTAGFGPAAGSVWRDDLMRRAEARVVVCCGSGVGRIVGSTKIIGGRLSGAGSC